MEYVQYEQGYAVQVRHIISTNEDFGTSEVYHQYKIWSAGKAHHHMLEKEGTYCKIHWPDISCF